MEAWNDLVHLASPTEERYGPSLDVDLRGDEVVDVLLEADSHIAAAVAACRDEIVAAVDLGVRTWQAGGVVHYAGAGTSGRLAVLDAVELAPTYNVGPERFQAHLAGGTRAMTTAAEGAEDDEGAGYEVGRALRASDLLVGVAASGRTPYVAGALRGAREAGAATVLIASNPGAPLRTEADVAILPDTGPEVVTGSTRMKAATAQKLVLNTFSTAVMVRCGKTYSNLMIDVRATNEKLRGRSVRMLVQATGLSDVTCGDALRGADGNVRVALVALLAGTRVEAARAALAAFPPDPGRTADPSGIRSAAQRARIAER